MDKALFLGNPWKLKCNTLFTAGNTSSNTVGRAPAWGQERKIRFPLRSSPLKWPRTIHVAARIYRTLSKSDSVPSASPAQPLKFHNHFMIWLLLSHFGGEKNEAQKVKFQLVVAEMKFRLCFLWYHNPLLTPTSYFLCHLGNESSHKCPHSWCQGLHHKPHP